MLKFRHCSSLFVLFVGYTCRESLAFLIVPTSTSSTRAAVQSSTRISAQFPFFLEDPQTKQDSGTTENIKQDMLDLEEAKEELLRMNRLVESPFFGTVDFYDKEPEVDGGTKTTETKKQHKMYTLLSDVPTFALSWPPHPPHAPPSEQTIHEAVVDFQAQMCREIIACYDMIAVLLDRLEAQGSPNAANPESSSNGNLKDIAVARLDSFNQQLKSIEQELDKEEQVAWRLDRLQKQLALLKFALEQDFLKNGSDSRPLLP